MSQIVGFLQEGTVKNPKTTKTSDSVLKPTENRTKLRALATKLQKQDENVNKFTSQQSDSTENKKCEKY